MNGPRILSALVVIVSLLVVVPLLVFLALTHAGPALAAIIVGCAVLIVAAGAALLHSLARGRA